MQKKKKRKTSGLGGRPRIRQGDEVQVTVEFPLIFYARLSAYVAHRKDVAVRTGDSVWEQSKKHVLLKLWQNYWESLEPDLKREIEDSDSFRKVMSRLTPGSTPTGSTPTEAAPTAAPPAAEPSTEHPPTST